MHTLFLFLASFDGHKLAIEHKAAGQRPRQRQEKEHETNRIRITGTGRFRRLGLFATVARRRDAERHASQPGLAAQAESADWQVTEITVIVPETLSVSEANSIKPRADIVWREDPLGNRHAQVQAVVQEAMDSPSPRWPRRAPRRSLWSWS